VLYGKVICGRNENYNFEFGNDFDVDNDQFLRNPTEQHSTKTSRENEMSQFPKCYVLFGLTDYKEAVILYAT
jgi:hypothetical protein